MIKNFLKPISLLGFVLICFMTLTAGGGGGGFGLKSHPMNTGNAYTNQPKSGTILLDFWKPSFQMGIKLILLELLVLL